jgi:aspartyl-tRNA(Asn)/glutamyl-tRNA(Gln) amidotransferase subunit C
MDKSQIRHVAELAQLTLSDEEEARLTDEVGRIVAYFAELDAVDTADVPPTTNVAGALADRAPLRADEVHSGLSHDEALAGAPRPAHGGFSVPTFVE